MAIYNVSSGVTSTGITLSGAIGYSNPDRMYISDGGTADSTTVNGYNASMFISGGGMAKNTIVTSNGTISISSGGTVDNTTVVSGGEIVISGGGIATGTDIFQGYVTVSGGGTATGTTTYYTGTLRIESGGSAANTVVTGFFSFLTASSCSEIRETVVTDRGEFLLNGHAISTTVRNAGQLWVYSGGEASSASVSNFGAIYLLAGGSGHEISVGTCGTLHVGRGGVATAIRENGGCIEVADGANVTFVPNTFSGALLTSGEATLHSGTTAVETTIDNAAMTVFDGAIAKGTQVNGGVLTISSGGKVTDRLTISKAAVVIAHEDSVVDFDISGQSPGEDAMVNDLSLVQGTPDFTITVSADQASGRYTLAGGAEGFAETVTVRMTDDTALGTISVDGKLAAGDKTYALAKESGMLSFTVSGNVPTDGSRIGVVAGGFSGGSSTEVLKHNADGTLAIFNTQTNTSTPVGTLDRAKWAIKGAGDYSHTGATEVLMQNLQTGDVRLVANAAAGISEESVEQSLRLGIVSGGYELGGVGNFNGSTHPGVLLTAPEQVSPGWSKVTGLACWTLDNAFNMSPGWLGAMVTTWDGGTFKMDPADVAGASDATINAKYYSFELIGVGDFNGDGRDDVMIRNNMPKTAEGRTITGSGDVFVFLTGSDISGFQEVNVAYTGCAADPWRLAGVGDLNGDGIQDAILQNTEDGTIASWILNSEAKYVNAYGMGTLTAGQSFAGVGDVNGDGTDDVLFTDFDGSLKAWTVQNGAGKGLIALG